MIVYNLCTEQSSSTSFIIVSSESVELPLCSLSDDPLEQGANPFYYDLLKGYISVGRGLFKTAHINVKGILTKSKLNEIKLLLKSTRLNVLGITESKLTFSTKDEALEINGYKLIRKGDSLMVMVLEDVCCILLKIYDLWKSFFSSNLDHIEAIWVDIIFHSQRFALSVCIDH